MLMNKLFLIAALIGVPAPLAVQPDIPVLPAPLEEPVFSQADVDCLSRNIYFEAMGEPQKGKRAVGFVTLSRAQDETKSFPSTVCGVVFQKRTSCQFSWVCQRSTHYPKPRNAMDRLAWDTSQMEAVMVLSGQVSDPTNGALFYHSTSVNPIWNRKMVRTAVIGNHVFWKPRV